MPLSGSAAKTAPSSGSWPASKQPATSSMGTHFKPPKMELVVAEYLAKAKRFLVQPQHEQAQTCRPYKKRLTTARRQASLQLTTGQEEHGSPIIGFWPPKACNSSNSLVASQQQAIGSSREVTEFNWEAWWQCLPNGVMVNCIPQNCVAMLAQAILAQAKSRRLEINFCCMPFGPPHPMENARIDDVFDDERAACKWKLRCDNGSQRTITDLRKVRHCYRQVNVWDPLCLLSDFDMPPSRELFWTPPLVLPGRDDLSKVVAHLCPADHPRREWVLLPTADRSVQTALLHKRVIQRLTKASRVEPEVLLPACSWCGTPTGIYCDGFKSFKSREGQEPGYPIQYICGRPVCSTCDAWTNSCFECSFWIGIAKQHATSQPRGRTSKW